VATRPPPLGGKPGRPMVCCDCGMRVQGTIAMARRHGWEVWVGGGRCKRCAERPGVVGASIPGRAKDLGNFPAFPRGARGPSTFTCCYCGAEGAELRRAQGYTWTECVSERQTECEARQVQAALAPKSAGGGTEE
jgi:hypothetical protein